MATNMVSWLEVWTPEKVANAEDPVAAFANYVQQTVGVPWPTIKDMVITRKKSKEFFQHYPNADWYTLCRVAVWARSKKKRPSRTWQVIELFREAWTKGALPELDPENRTNHAVEEGIAKALTIETDEWWRNRLVGCKGVTAREKALREWTEEHGVLV